MKQGSANRNVSESAKREPNARAVSVAETARIGVEVIRTESKDLYKGRGYEAPKNTSQSHKNGSQGKY